MKKGTQKEIQQWLCRLEETAINGHVKTRLLDAVRDCKKDLQKKLTPETWADRSRELDELLEQLKKQMPYETKGETPESEVRQKASEMIERCRRSNDLRKKDYVNDSDTYIQEAEKAMRDLCNVAANYEEVTRKERFVSAVHSIGEKYKLQIDEVQEKYIHVLHQNYQHMFDRMKELFYSAGYGEETQRKFYETYYANLDVLAGDTAGYARKLEKGQSSMADYAEEVQGPIQKTIKRLKGRAARKKRLPMLVLLLAAVLWIGGKTAYQWTNEVRTEEASVQGEAVQEEAPAGETTASKIGEAVKIGGTVAKEVSKSSGTGKILKAVLSVILSLVMGWGIPFLLLVFVLYWLWTRSVDRHCRDQIVKETSDLQNTALQEWERQGTLTAAVEKSFEAIEIYVYSKYEELLMQLSGDQKKTVSEKELFQELCAEWEMMKRKVEF